ncbi:PREDICTED: protein FAM78A [Colobus angolensis palliatus]|uniref:protein FAM78A n=1 Tax=Colobus angolensis palliatus TaxID=336983 RepID=UPI0005F53208|nr:PREDICTED: protein FAM78A [Colobus angolensis palliatus]
MPGFLCDCWPSLEIRALLCAMGCIQSIGGKARVFREGITVIDVKASIDPVPTSIDESSSVVLRYRTPHFRASAQVVMPPIPKKETWIVGWIQACSHMEFYNQYGEQGMWQKTTLCRQVQCSPGEALAATAKRSLSCSREAPSPECAWGIGGPGAPELHISHTPSTRQVLGSLQPGDDLAPALALSHAPHDAVLSASPGGSSPTNDMIILQTLHWRMQLSIEVNPNRPLGQRARLREPIAQDQPKILSKNEPIPPSALVKPNANDAQVLMWRPKYGQPLVVIPPKHR